MRYDDGALIPYDPNFVGAYKAIRCRLLIERDYLLMLAVVRDAEIFLKTNGLSTKLRDSLNDFNKKRTQP